MDTRTILITGCSSGIGRCVARGLATRGYRVFATARRREDVEHLRAEGLAGLQLDLADSASIAAAVDEVLERTDGHLYALFNNGAYGQPGAVEDLSREVLRLQFETNLFGWHELTNRVLPVMRQQGYGRIIHNSSVLGFVALPFRGAYTASKYALEGLTDTLRLELRGSGIHGRCALAEDRQRDEEGLVKSRRSRGASDRELRIGKHCGNADLGACGARPGRRKHDFGRFAQREPLGFLETQCGGHVLLRSSQGRHHQRHECKEAPAPRLTLLRATCTGCATPHYMPV